MTGPLRLLLLPLQAPMLLLLLAVSIYMGLHWGQPMQREGLPITPMGSLLWTAECAQALVVVLLCSMPDLLLRRFTTLLVTSRVISLVATLLLVTVGGLYLLHLDVLSNVLILSSSVLLARLDLARIRVVPPPPVLALLLSLLVLVGAGLGHRLSGAWDWNAEPGAAKRPPAKSYSRTVPQGEWRAPLFGRVRGESRTTAP